MKPISLDSNGIQSLVLVVTVFVLLAAVSIISGKIIRNGNKLYRISNVGIPSFIATTNDLKDMKGDAAQHLPCCLRKRLCK